MKPIIAVHLDLKGMQFKPTYLPAFLSDLASQGVNTLLVEYEDVFPFQGLDIAQDRAMVWPLSRVKKLGQLANKHGIQIIPLQQCLGHLEYLLSWKSHRRYALDKAYPSTLDIHQPRAKKLVQDMLSQVISAHPDSQYIHLGMDEAHALVKHHGQDNVVGVFLDYLDDLLAITSAAGKTAIIWADMLENHLQQLGDRLKTYKDHVILACWDYETQDQPTAVARLGGRHIRRHWRDHPEDTTGPAISPATTDLEDQPVSLRQLMKPYEEGHRFSPLHLIDFWTKLGFRVLGCSALRASAHGNVLPDYNRLLGNITVWSAAVRRNQQLGHLATSWARGTSFIPPNFCIDLAWPAVTTLACSMGKKPQPFFEGVDEKTVDRLIRSLGLCKKDWSIELQIADEMDALLPRVKTHRHEWQGMSLMARVLDVHRRAGYALAEMNVFHANHRPVESEWQRRLADQKKVLTDIARMRQKVIQHFGKRWHGQAFEEWVRSLFDLHETQLRQAGKDARRKAGLARKTYASRG